MKEIRSAMDEMIDKLVEKKATKDKKRRMIYRYWRTREENDRNGGRYKQGELKMKTMGHNRGVLGEIPAKMVEILMEEFGMNKETAKRVAKEIAMILMIGTNMIWKRRENLYKQWKREGNILPEPPPK